jgi:hypothetical protein
MKFNGDNCPILFLDFYNAIYISVSLAKSDINNVIRIEDHGHYRVVTMKDHHILRWPKYSILSTGNCIEFNGKYINIKVKNPYIDLVNFIK